MSKVTKYDVRISLLTVSVYELFERPSYERRAFVGAGKQRPKMAQLDCRRAR